MTRSADIVVVGGGIAAVSCAQALRDNGHTGRLTLLTEESEHPYDRPPLSKEMLQSEDPREPSWLLPPDLIAELDIDLRLDHKVIAVDTRHRVLSVADRDVAITYDDLVVATGTRARTLPVLAGLEGVHHLRTADDARSIREVLRRGAPLTIVGAGFIGLEVASSARAHGCAVTIIEVAEHPLAHVLGDRLAAWLQKWHTDQGVQFRCGVSIDRAASTAGRITLTLDDGTDVASEAVVVGIGVDRDVGWLAASGVETHLGLVCDVNGRSRVNNIFGAGDVVCMHVGDACSPVQHWTAAAESGHRVARTMLGLDPEPSLEEHYFWSNQAGLRLMSVGRRTVDAELEIVSGDLAEGKFVAHWTEGDRLVGVIGANSVKDFLRSRNAFRTDSESVTATH